MVEDLTQYLFSNNMLRFIEGYVQKVCGFWRQLGVSTLQAANVMQ
jgi:hypothetical protein